jgi:serine/threonine protein kinase
MPDMTDLRPGDPEEIAGYRVLSRLGAGGQGVVYLADSPSGERVAIKQLRTGLEDPRVRQQFVKEVAAARRVAPFCTARVVEALLDGPSPYVVSEYIEGLSLQQQIQRHGPMTGPALTRLAIGTATALAAIHQAGVVHRDLKPANVMLAADGPRVIDFGIARDLSTETTITSRIFGTPAYMAPEQLRAERVGPATDMFAWASVIAYAATGRAPFEAPHMMAVVHRITTGEPDLADVPIELVPVLRRCLSKEPAERPSAQQALALLLGRPVPVHDATDATQVLAEATGLVRTGGPATTVNYQGHSPTQVLPSRPATSPTGAGPTGAGPTHPIPPTGPHTYQRGRAIAGALAVLLLVLGGAWALTHRDLLSGDSADTPSSSGSSPAGASGAATSSPYADPTTTPAEPTTAPPTSTAPATTTTGDDDNQDGATIPDAFDGDWEGTGYQPLGTLKSWQIKIKLEAGETTGELELPDLNCSGPLTVSSSQNGVLTLDLVIDENKDGLCAQHGIVRLTGFGSGRLGFLWQDADHQTNQATGTLRKT